MMLRKSHSTDWNVPGTNNKSMMEAAPIVSEGHALAVQRHFDELKRIDLTELQSSFEAWASTKRQVLTEDKSSYLKTLSEEADTVEALKKQLATLVARRQAIVTALQEEQTEYDQGLAANEELEVQREALSSRLKALKDESKRVTSTLIAEEAGNFYVHNFQDVYLILDQDIQNHSYKIEK